MNVVMIAAWALAVISAFFVHPDGAYFSYLDYHTLGLLFCLMTVMAGLKRLGVFRYLALKMLKHISNTRQLEFILVYTCFFTSMLITNDMALITFVPFAIEVLEMAGLKKSLIPLVAMQTVAANLGSMMTPMGNPQNLYLYSQSGYGADTFMGIMAPYGLASAILIFVFLMLRKNMSLSLLALEDTEPSFSKMRLGFYGVLFLLSLLSVLHVLPVWLLVILTIVSILILDRRTLKDVDYGLLLTFAGFFIFIGNMGRISAFSDFLAGIIGGREVITSVAASQVISNVPAALLLSGFTREWTALMIGTNLGGLGTLIASMASLISYKFMAEAYPKKKLSYLGYFTVVNVIFLAILLGLYFVQQYMHGG